MDPDRGASTYKGTSRDEVFELLAASARKKVIRSIAKRQKLIKNLYADIDRHGDPEIWKRCGDLILANVRTAIRDGDNIRVTDYFDKNLPEVNIVGESHLSLSDIAENYFRLYAKARNGKRVIENRLDETEKAIEADQITLTRIETAIENNDIEFLAEFSAPKRKAVEVRRKKKNETEFKGARKFISSDGFIVLVGKKAKDNDFLTFRVSRSLDTWMHAADFPGSHVLIQNPNRKPIPERTLIEAAQLAAFYSNARELGKAAVNYTLKKFVNKPKRSAPGLVSLASFKTVLVKPEVSAGIMKEES